MVVRAVLPDNPAMPAALLLFLVASTAPQEPLERPAEGFRITPPEGWVLQEPAGGAFRYVASWSPPATTAVVQLAVRIIDAQGPVTTPAAARSIIEAQVRAMDGDPVLSELGRRLAGQQAPGVEIDLTQRGVRYRVRQYYVAGNDRIYTLNAHAPKERFTELEEVFEAALDTFALVPLTAEAREEHNLRRLAARCGSELDWAPDWEEAARRARKLHRPVLVVAQVYGGFDISDGPAVGPFMEPDVVALVKSRFVPLRFRRDLEAPFRDPEVYGLSGSTFGQALLIVSPEGKVLRETFSMDERAVYDLLRVAAGEFGGVTQPPPAGLGRLEQARWWLENGDLARAATVLRRLRSAPGEDRAEAWLLQARLQRLRRDGKAALEALREAVRAGAEPSRVAIERAETLARLGDFAAAEAALDAAPGAPQPRALWWRGALRLRRGDVAGARAAWEQLVAAHPEDRWAWRAAGMLISTTMALGLGMRLDWPPEEELAATRPPPYESLPPRLAPRALAEAVDWLLAHQRADGSWLSPGEISSPQEEVHIFTETNTALGGLALLRSGTAKGRVAAGGALEHLLATWERGRDQEDERVYYMDYMPWLDAYALFFFAACVQEELGDPDVLRPVMAELVADLGERQKGGGGWSYYVSGSLEGAAQGPPEVSMSFTTAAVILALMDARAAGVAVPEAMMSRALDCLEGARSPQGTFAYMVHHGADNVLQNTGAPGAAGRGPVCALALFRGEREDATGLIQRLEIYAQHAAGLARERGKALMHAGPDTQGSHYLLFDHQTAAAAVAALPRGKRGGHRSVVLEQILGCRLEDRSFLDNPALGQASGTALAVLGLLELGVRPR